MSVCNVIMYHILASPFTLFVTASCVVTGLRFEQNSSALEPFARGTFGVLRGATRPKVSTPETGIECIECIAHKSVETYFAYIQYVQFTVKLTELLDQGRGSNFAKHQD